MDNKAFETKIKQGLEKLSKEQQVKFAWRCAVRALPFLGSNGNFDFWNEDKRQKFIYAIFYALDLNASNSIGDENSHAVEMVREAANTVTFFAYNEASDVANAATYAASPSDYMGSYSFAAKAAVNAVISAFFCDDEASLLDNTLSSAINASSAAKRNNIDLELFILQDLRRTQGHWEQLISIRSYGELWDNFQKALEAEGCAYWGNLYKEIFENGFELDQEALERRLNVPKEIREQGAAAVAIHLEEIEEKGAARLNEARIIILGEKGAGKTCIARKLVDPKAAMTKDDESTAGVDTSLWKLKKENINVRIWDFAGHTVTHAVHQFFLSERCLYLMVYDGRSEDRNRLEYWLDHMKNYGGDSKAIVLVNKRDQHTVDIYENYLKEQYPIAGIYSFSIKDDKAELEEFRKDIAQYITKNPSWERQEIPLNYYQVKKELEKLFIKGEKEKGVEHITKEEFNKIAKKHDVKDTEKLLEGLHSLGVSLWYKKMEDFNTLILNPEWISNGVYSIINWVSKEKRHDISLSDFTKVFNGDASRYPIDKHDFLFSLMKHYELAFETDNEKCLIIPHLLKEDRPAELPAFHVGESLMLRYKSEMPLPPNTISRFIVRHNQEIKKEGCKYIVWRYGVVLEDGRGSLALVREEDRTISVSVKGNDKTNYISTLRETLNDIFDTYKSKKPELEYRIEGFGQISNEPELWLPDRKIKNHIARNRPYFDDETGQELPMADTIINYNIYAPNTTIAGRDLDNSTHNTFNFYDCNIGLQGNLNELAQLMAENGNAEEAKELENVAKVLELAEECKSKEEVKKKGIGNRLKRIAEDLGNEDSKLHKTVEGIKNGIGIAQDIAKTYNDFAQWLGLPQVPKPFLKKEKA